jgi:F420H(2)-dependent quinone reductase
MTRRYLGPNWMQRHVGNRLAPLSRPSMIAKLIVRGRRSGRWRTVPIVVVDYDGERYLIAYRGASDWALNLAATRTARLNPDPPVGAAG